MNKRKIKNLIILVLITTFFGSSIALAQKIPQIPQDIRNEVPEKDWIELYCYEAKSRGGEAVAKVEALAELLPPLLEKVEELGIKVETPDLLSISRDLESQLEAVCQQTTLEATQAKLQEFISKANSVRNTLGPDLRNQIEPALKAKGEEIRAKLEKELRAEGEAMGKEIEAKLRAQAEQEAKQIEARLRKELKRQIEEELKAQYGGKEDIDEEYLLELGRKKGEERGRKAGKKAREELDAKYKKLAQQERERITKLMEKKADEIGGEEKRKLEEIRDGFLNLEANLESLAQAKMARWLVFREKAIQKKKEILIATMGAQIDKGKELIMAHKEEIDQARAEGKDIPSAEELVAQLEADKQSLIDKLSKGELNEILIRQAGEELKMKWDKIRFDLEKIQKRSSQEIYQTLKQRLSQQGFTLDLIASLDVSNGKMQQSLKIYNNWRQWCRMAHHALGTKDEKKYINPAYVWLAEYHRDELCYYNFGQQAKYYKTLGDDLVKVAKVEKEALTKLKEILNYNENSSTDDLLAFKRELVEALNKYKASMNEFKSKYSWGWFVSEIKTMKALTYGL